MDAPIEPAGDPTDSDHSSGNGSISFLAAAVAAVTIMKPESKATDILLQLTRFSGSKEPPKIQ